jgi:two-component system response regulator HydG
VLILGETGTGKELVARSIHQQSRRARQTLISVNCAAIPETLIESELFGYEKGAFTGANTNRMGLIEAADGGTLFLDEIGELPMEAQARLLRFIQEGEIRRIGSVQSRKVDVRLICATHRDLQTRRRGQFPPGSLLPHQRAAPRTAAAARARQGHPVSRRAPPPRAARSVWAARR